MISLRRIHRGVYETQDRRFVIERDRVSDAITGRAIRRGWEIWDRRTEGWLAGTDPARFMIRRLRDARTLLEKWYAG